MSKGQSPVEFIIVVFLFLIILVTIFTTFIAKLNPEIDKAKEQESCLNSDGLAISLLKAPGVPVNWNSSNMEIFSLTNGTEDYIYYDKWLTAKSMEYMNVRVKTIPDASFLLSYQIYAFKPKNSADSCPASGNATVVCRYNLTSLQIKALPSGTNATFNLKMFFPFSTATITDISSESDDIKTTSSANGTIVTLSLHTNATDSDLLNITFSQTNMIFVQSVSYKTAGTANLPVYLGDTSIVDSFGSAGTGVNSYCESERAVSFVDKTGEVFLARFSVLTW